MGCISGIIKIIMFVFNFLCLLVGLVLLVLGVLIYVAVGDVKNHLPGAVVAIPIGVIIIGVFIFLVSFLGCCGAIKSNKCMLLTYAVILIIILVIQLAVGIFGLVKFNNNYDEFKNQVNHELKEILDKYGTDNSSNAIIDSIQISFSCCGIYNQTDYGPISQYPGSCCGKTNSGEYCTSVETSDKKGCGDLLFSTIDYYITAICITILVVCGVELLGAVFAIYLSRKK